jgi:hypothetical protein
MLTWSARPENTRHAATKKVTFVFERSRVPNAMLRERSTAIITFSSRSACVSRTKGTFNRAVTFQSIRRTSSPGR